MQDLFKKYLPYFLLLLLVAVTVLVWLLVFPTETGLVSNSALFESIYLIVSFICFYLIGLYYSPGKIQSESRISESYRDELDYMAHHDVLTGLPNRILFTDRLQQAIASAKRKYELLKKADKSMYKAKDISGSAFDVFNHSESEKTE